MIGMTLQMVKSEVAEYIISVPAMVLLAAFIAAVFVTLAQQAVVLNIVCAGQLELRQKLHKLKLNVV